MRCLLVVGAMLTMTSPSFALEHAHEVWGGWLECDLGYVMRANECVTVEQIEAERVIVSDLPSAGEGAPGTCPSGGCFSNVAPSYYYDAYAYSAPFFGGWSYPYVGGWSYSRHWRDERSPLQSFAQTGFQNAPRRFNAVPDRRSPAGFASRLFFGGSSRGRGR